MVLWFDHPKYTAEYVSGQLTDICVKVRRETRRMVYVAMAATMVMVAVQSAYLLDLLRS
ncbi:MAG: hypothetical protein V3571_11135 [Pseudodesulfovibrio sp.]